jgi:membrane associated rhomboid family serine protease
LWHVASVANAAPYDAPPRSDDLAREAQPQPPQARDVPVTTALIVVNVLVFMLEETWGNSQSVSTLLRMGAIYRGTPDYFHWATCVSYGYLHIGVIHLGVNMFALWNIGRLLEPLLGKSRFFVLYTLSLVGGGIAISLSPTPHVTAGASGALFGLLGAVCALLYRRYRNARLPLERREIGGLLGRLLVPNLLISLLPGVSLLGHAGGLVVGAVFVARTFLKPSQLHAPLPTPRRSRSLDALALALLLLTLGSVASVWLSHEPWRDAPDIRLGQRGDGTQRDCVA